MNAIDRKYLDLLKREISVTLRKNYPAIPTSMADWKGTEITYFQDDLREQQNQSISEKWFYTHMKSNHENLPRIDILNILSQYVGYLDWSDFKYNKNEPSQVSDGSQDKLADRDKSSRVFYMIPILVAVALLIFLLLLKLFDFDLI